MIQSDQQTAAYSLVDEGEDNVNETEPVEPEEGNVTMEVIGDPIAPEGPPLVTPVAQESNPTQTTESPLQVVFWNANSWNTMKCDQLLETVRMSGADLICISDARLDSFGKAYIEGYCKKLRGATGKTWRGKLEARPDKKPKCMIGGDIVFFSEECSKVTKTAITPYGTVSRINMLWKGAEVRVVSIYRPYPGAEGAVGSLRNAVTKLDPDFEDSFWDGALTHSDVPMLIGGDFNLGMNEMDKKILGRECYRLPFLESTTTFRSLAGAGWGSTIDHVLSNRKGSTARVSADGLFSGDHFPIIGTIYLQAGNAVRPPKIEIKLPPSLRAGDNGGLKRLEEAIKKETQRHARLLDGRRHHGVDSEGGVKDRQKEKQQAQSRWLVSGIKTPPPQTEGNRRPSQKDG